MKKVLALVAVAGLIAASTAFAQVSIKGSKHDLSGTTGPATSGLNKAGGNTQICIYCHAPHGAGADQLLWNRTNPSGSFLLYQIKNGANDNTANYTGFTSDSTSLFCMSCHDGSTTMQTLSHSGNAGVLTATGGNLTTGFLQNANAAFGSDLQTTHPINFPVGSNSQSDLYITSPATATSMGGGAGTSLTAFPLFASGGNSNFLECGSCHAVHDAEFVPFLRTTLGASTLCLGCHNK